jgi:uncharacterized protein
VRGKFEIVVRPGNGSAFWRLRAANGEILCHSEDYANEMNARKGIASVRLNAPFAGTEVVPPTTVAPITVPRT